MSKEVSYPKPDMLSPAEIQAKTVQLAIGKAGTSLKKNFLLAIGAGIFIGLGAMYFTFVMADASLSFAIQRVLGGLLFCTGLFLVITCGSELFTGDVLMIQAFMSKKISLKHLVSVLIVVWLGNLVGSLILVGLIYYSGVYGMNDGGVAAASVSVAAGKTSLSLSAMLFRGIMCNLLVCLAVWVSFGAKSTVDKFFAILLPISAFVACGFEHSVANMFFLPMGLVQYTAGVVPAGAALETLNLAGVAINLGMVTLGNIIGGMLFVGVAYWLIYARPIKEA